MFIDKLKLERDNHEIKLTSDDILNKFHLETSVKKSFNYKPIFAFGVTFALLITGGIILFNEDENIVKNKYANILSLEVKSSLDFIENYNTLNLNNIKRKNNLDDDTFKDICNNFLDNYSTLKATLDYKENQNFVIEEDNFNINDSTYTYKVTLEENKYLYFNIDSKVNDKITKEKYIGVLEISSTYYEMIGARKVNSNNKKDEIDIRIEMSNKTYMTIEQETERSESSYSYSIIENNEEIYELEIDFEKDEIEMECLDHNKEFEYEIKKLDDEFNIHYSYEYIDLEVEGMMNLTIENNKFTFEDKNNSKKLDIYQ